MLIPLALTSLAMVAFAANSLLARGALSEGAIDAAGYTAIRIVSGALALALIVFLQRGRSALRDPGGSWLSALSLFAYAVAFSYAYLRLGAASGALVLFASVQATMIGWGALRGNRPGGLELLGVAIAFAAFVWLLLPGLGAPDLPGSLLMILSGIAWGAYSLRGRGATDPIRDTAGNFLRSAVLCIPPVPLALTAPAATAEGILLALLSGVVASGLRGVVPGDPAPHADAGGGRATHGAADSSRGRSAPPRRAPVGAAPGRRGLHPGRRRPSDPRPAPGPQELKRPRGRRTARSPAAARSAIPQGNPSNRPAAESAP